MGAGRGKSRRARSDASAKNEWVLEEKYVGVTVKSTVMGDLIIHRACRGEPEPRCVDVETWGPPGEAPERRVRLYCAGPSEDNLVVSRDEFTDALLGALGEYQDERATGAVPKTEHWLFATEDDNAGPTLAACEVDLNGVRISAIKKEHENLNGHKNYDLEFLNAFTAKEVKGILLLLRDVEAREARMRELYAGALRVDTDELGRVNF